MGLFSVISMIGAVAAVGGYFAFQPHRHFEVSDIPDLSTHASGVRTVAIVTGANTGIGLDSARELARNGAHVILACRSEKRCSTAAETIRTDTGSKFVEHMILDLSSFASVRSFTAAFRERGLPLHILMASAGVMAAPFKLTEDGNELQVAVNHLGHALLILDLLDIVEASAPSRIVSASSRALNFAPKEINFETLNSPDAYDPVGNYGISKLFNVLFARALARRLADKDVFVNAAHPGFVQTELTRNIADAYHPLLQKVVEISAGLVAYSPLDGALTQLYLASSPEVVSKNIRGQYYIPIAHHKPHPSDLAMNDELSEKLWTWTQQQLPAPVEA